MGCFRTAQLFSDNSDTIFQSLSEVFHWFLESFQRTETLQIAPVDDKESRTADFSGLGTIDLEDKYDPRAPTTLAHSFDGALEASSVRETQRVLIASVIRKQKAKEVYSDQMNTNDHSDSTMDKTALKMNTGIHH